MVLPLTDDVDEEVEEKPNSETIHTNEYKEDVSEVNPNDPLVVLLKDYVEEEAEETPNSETIHTNEYKEDVSEVKPNRKPEFVLLLNDDAGAGEKADEKPDSEMMEIKRKKKRGFGHWAGKKIRKFCCLGAACC